MAIKQIFFIQLSLHALPPAGQCSHQQPCMSESEVIFSMKSEIETYFFKPENWFKLPEFEDGFAYPSKTTSDIRYQLNNRVKNPQPW